MPKEQEIMDFLEARFFKPILESEQGSERFKKATRGLRLRMKERDAQGMIQYFWQTVADPSAKGANYGRILQNQSHVNFEEVLSEFRIRFKEL